MIITQELTSLQAREKPIVLAAGFFDGVHIGHQSVIKHAICAAREVGGESWLMTFSPHPMKVLKPEIAPLMITAEKHKLALMEAYGIDGAIVIPFTREFASTPPSDFAAWLFRCAPTLKEIVVGENWRFGAKAAGTPELLANLGEVAGITVQTMPPVMHCDEAVSSTRIRAAIQAGDLPQARQMLGRPAGVLGTVIHGREIGRKLGFPSANIDPHNEVLPPHGIYAVDARIKNEFHIGALSYGSRPTFDGHKDNEIPILELHLIDFDRDLYDQNIEIFLLTKLRDQWKFETPEALQQQIALDVEHTRIANTQHGMPEEQKLFLRHGAMHL